jgi:serine/threonine-protein kinase HipA
MEERPVGTFLEASDGAISFEYDKAAPAVPISLSLPRGGGWPRRSPSLLLDNLLPDGENARRAMMRASGAEGMDAFSLLDGADSSGDSYSLWARIIRRPSVPYSLRALTR